MVVEYSLLFPMVQKLFLKIDQEMRVIVKNKVAPFSDLLTYLNKVYLK